MTHATEGLLQAYLDGEIDSPAVAELREHLDGCELCSSELRELQSAAVHVHEALGLIAADAPMLRARAAIAAARRESTPVQQVSEPASAWRRLSRLGAGSFARAAMLLLALAGAGAAAIPGSPVRLALETTFARVAQFFGAGNGAVAVDAGAEAPSGAAPEAAIGSRMGVLPADGRVRVLLHPPGGEVEVTVRLVDAARAQVETAMAGQGVRFRTGAGRIEVAGLGAGRVIIEIPRTVQAATIEVNGLIHVYKQGAVLQLSGPAGREQGEQVRFRIGT
jgi:anti-sigma factor RsiW